METRMLGADLEVSAIGLGCMGLSHAYGTPTTEREAVALLREAVELGCTFFDTAEVYGAPDDPHHNEHLVGKALAPVCDRVTIATKFGLSFNTSAAPPYPLVPDARPETVRASVEGSLTRLGAERIDLYYLHRIDPAVPVEEVAETMADLMKEGKVAHWGLSEADENHIRRAHAVCPLTAVQNRYSMMARHYEPLFGALEELGIGLVAFSPMANGLLTCAYDKDSTFDPATDYRASMPQFGAEGIERNRALLDLIRTTAAEHVATPAQLSLAWMLCKKPWIVPIPGTRKSARLKENLGAASVRLTAEEVSALDAALDACPMSEVFGGTRPATTFSSCNH